MARATYSSNNQSNNNNNTASKTPPKKRKSKKKSVGKIILRTVIAIFIVILLLLSVIAGALIGFEDNRMDMIAEEYNLDFTSIIYYVDSESNQPVELDRVHRNENREWVDIEDLPENLPNAFIAIEDERFRKHGGVDLKRTFGAFVQWVMGKDSYGGSTITQQLVKNITGDNDRSPLRKIQEIIRAMNLERKMSKDQIIEMYMNTIYFGEGCHGVQTASKHYFNKDASDLSLEECASLAAIVKAPTTYNPANNYENNKERRNVVLNKMAELDFISDEECSEAKAKETVIKVGETDKDGANEDVKSYFVDAVIRDVIQDLMEKEKLSESEATNRLYTGGFKIYSTYDPNVQEAIDNVYTNTSNFPNSQVQSAMVVMDPYTGHIKGMAGGVGVKTVPRGLNRATQSKRQPGSSFKPVAVYGPAIEYNVVTPATLVKDAPLTIGDWSPKNSGGGYAGMMTVRRAIEKSQNIPAVKVMRELTPEKSYDFLTQKLGFTTLVENETRNGKQVTDQTLSSALGGLTDGVTVEEMTAAYCAFVNKGMYNEPVTYTKVIDSNGRVILENKVQNQRAMSEETAYLMTNMLSGVVTNGTGTGARVPNVFTAGKTGTTNSNKDRWFMGITPNYVAGVWMGYDTPKTMSGSNFCPSVFRKVMTEIYADENVVEKSIPVPDGIVKRTVCQSSGKIASSGCGATRTEYFKDGTQPMRYCSGHVIEEETPTTPDDGVIDGNANEPGGGNIQNEGNTPGGSDSENDSESQGGDAT